MLTNILSFFDNQIVKAQGNTTITIPDVGKTEAASTPFSTLDAFVSFVINTVFGVGIAIALVFLIVCGIKYATSSGDQGKAEEARNCITNAIIGAVVIIAFRLLINLALNLLGIGSAADVTGTVN